MDVAGTGQDPEASVEAPFDSVAEDTGGPLWGLVIAFARCAGAGGREHG
jgi:hypothetical protein